MELLETLKMYKLLRVTLVVLTVMFKLNHANIQVKITHPQNKENSAIYEEKLNLGYIHHATCDYNGATYATGSFRLSDCVTCVCNGTTGDVTCSAKECPQIRNCIRYFTRPGECCPRCLEYGCFYNGTAYRPGQKISKGPCAKCFCPWETGEKTGGNPKCLTIKCNTPRCVDSRVPEGKCCPLCPNGPNCYLDNQIIPEGERIYVDKCRYCFCSSTEYIPRDQPRHATCERSFFCL